MPLAVGNANSPVFLNGVPVAYLLRDEFITAEAAPLASPRTAEPGPGTLTLVQTDGQFSIGGGALDFPAQATPNYGDQFLVGEGLARAAGRALLLSLNFDTADLNDELAIGWKTNAAITPALNAHIEHILWFYRSGALYVRENTSGSSQETYAAGTGYQVAQVLRSSGCLTLLKGGAFSEWTLAWVSPNNSTATLYPALTNYLHAGTLDRFCVADLPSPWNADYGIASQRLAGARVAGDTFTHEADCLVEFTVDALPAANQIELWFRKQDANNYWAVTVDASGNLDLDEVVGGVATQRGMAATVIAGGDRVVVVAEGTRIKVYEANALRINYGAAATFNTMTAGELDTLGTGGAVSNVVAWPRQLSGAALNTVQE